MLLPLILTVGITVAPVHTQNDYLPPVVDYVQDGYLPPPMRLWEPEPVFAPTFKKPPAVNEPSGMGSDVEQWRPLVAAYFPAEQVETALAIINCESGGNPNSKNPNSSARGLFQILTSLWGPHFGWNAEDFYVPELNVWAAARIWEMDGWNAWSCYHKVR